MANPVMPKRHFANLFATGKRHLCLQVPPDGFGDYLSNMRQLRGLLWAGSLLNRHLPSRIGQFQCMLHQRMRHKIINGDLAMGSNRTEFVRNPSIQQAKQLLGLRMTAVKPMDQIAKTHCRAIGM